MKTLMLVKRFSFLIIFQPFFQGPDKARERGSVAKKDPAAVGVRQIVSEENSVPEVGFHEHAPVK